MKRLSFPPNLLEGQKVALLAAHELTAPEAEFGGLSGLLLEGERLYLIGDRAIWIEARVERGGDGAVTKFASARLGPLRGASGRNLRGTWIDAEALARDGKGGFWLGFEGQHRIVRHQTLDGRAVEIGGPLQKKALGRNAGVEGLARAADGALWVLAEKKGPGGRQQGWRLWSGRAQSFFYDRIGPFDATGAEIGPDGALYVLERRFNWLSGVGIRIRRFTAAELRAVATGRTSELGAGETLAVFDNRAPIDNMEGIAVESRADGKLILTLISDDNFSAFQRTLLLQFLVDPAR